MRQRIDDRSKKSPPAVLEKNFKEIVVGNGRSQEPYIIAFHYSSDNVASQGLGTLFGFFEVEIHDQDAAYIVNFLASVAKKEYFANPRRHPVESFESALHKVNVALAEIVKHGNISWLGHLHGAIGTVSGNTLHFSVTGDGGIYLAREDTLHSISDGLANTDSEPHPLKTFTEVSSGELFDADLILALSPSVWSLFSPDDLRRSLHRLGPAGFEQFLRTALVNELPVAAVILLTCSAPVEIRRVPEKKESQSKRAALGLENVWSDKPFMEALRSKANPEPSENAENPAGEKLERKTYTDKQTGHIYVQASPDENPEVSGNRLGEGWALFRHQLETQARVWRITARKMTRRIRKESGLAFDALSAWSALSQRSIGRRIRTIKRSLEESLRDYQNAHKAPLTEASQPEAEIPEAPLTPVTEIVEATEERAREQALPATPSRLSAAVQLRLKERFSRLSAAAEPLPQDSPQGPGQKLPDVPTQAFDQMRSALASLPKKATGFWQTLAPKEKWSILGVASAIFVVVLVFLISTKETPSAVMESPADAQTEISNETIFPPADEPLSTLLSESHALLHNIDTRPIALLAVDDTSFLVTEKNIFNLRSQESTPTPESLRLATDMDDLDGIFALGESGTLYLYRVSNKKFERSSLPLPAGARIDALGTYLTYLYVLDQNTGTIYRFPRAEGGFGAPVTWSKESIASGENKAFAVYENIATADAKGSPFLYTRGKNTGVTFGGTRLFYSADALAFDTKTGDLLILDRYNRRIIRWSATGTLLAQYYQESFADAAAFALSPDGNEILISNQNSTSAWKIR